MANQAIPGCSLPTPDQGGQYVKGWMGYRNSCLRNIVENAVTSGALPNTLHGQARILTGGDGGNCKTQSCVRYLGPPDTSGSKTTTGTGTTTGSGSGTTTGGTTSTTPAASVDMSALLKKYWPLLVLAALYFWAGAE